MALTKTFKHYIAQNAMANVTSQLCDDFQLAVSAYSDKMEALKTTQALVDI